jgi:predicted membrane protein
MWLRDLDADEMNLFLKEALSTVLSSSLTACSIWGINLFAAYIQLLCYVISSFWRNLSQP